MNKLEKFAIVFGIISIILVWIFIIWNEVYAEPFLPGVEGVNNVTWGSPEDYPDGYYKEGYPVDD